MFSYVTTLDSCAHVGLHWLDTTLDRVDKELENVYVKVHNEFDSVHNELDRAGQAILGMADEGTGPRLEYETAPSRAYHGTGPMFEYVTAFASAGQGTDTLHP